MKLGHVHLKVKELTRAEKFYTTALNATVSERLEDHYSFLTVGEAHHDIALQALGSSAAPPPLNAVGLYHSAFEVKETAELKEVIRRLDSMNIHYQMVDHGISWALYTEDPDGNGVEFYLDRRRAAKGRTIWNGYSTRLTLDNLIETS
ncbi:MAG: VOC family protein [Bdellovibrionales bacterium]|nr:VOC family protein [Bdellovibrionales bacterium]